MSNKHRKPPFTGNDGTFEEEWVASTPDEKIEYGLRFLQDLKRLIEEGADIDPQLITKGEKVVEQYRRAKIEEKIATENLRVSRIESKLARDAYFDSLNDDDIPHV